MNRHHTYESREPISADQPAEKNTGTTRREFLLTLGAGLTAALDSGKRAAAAELIEDFLNKDAEGMEPKIELEIFFAPHATREDATGLKERIRASDIYIPEIFGWDERVLVLYRAIAQGKIGPEGYFKELGASSQEIQEIKKTLEYTETEILYNSGKRVEFIDLPDTNRIYSQLDKEITEPKFRGKENASEVISAYKQNAHKIVLLQKERELYMLEQLAELQKKIAAGEIQELKGRSTVKILIFLGAYHTEFLHRLHRKGKKVLRSSPTFYVYRHNEEMMRCFAFGKEITDDLAAKSILEILMDSFLSDKLDEVTRSSHERNMLERAAAEKFSTDEIKDLIEQILQGASIQTVRETLLKKLREKGVESFAVLKQKIKPRKNSLTKPDEITPKNLHD